jgi:hypothetical protein
MSQDPLGETVRQPIYLAYGSGSSGSIGWGSVSTGDYQALRNAAARTILSQSIQININATISKITLPLARYLDEIAVGPTGNVWVEIHSSQTGTSATKNASTNIVGAASDDVDVTSIQINYGWIDFNFSGTKPYLTADTDYYIVLYGDYDIDADKYIGWTYQSAGGYGDGSGWAINGSLAWSAYAGDFTFKGYGQGEVTVSKHDTELANEIDRALATVVDTTARVKLRYEFTFASAVTVMEVGVFDKETGGNMIFHGAYGSSNKIEGSTGKTYQLDVTLIPEQG